MLHARLINQNLILFFIFIINVATIITQDQGEDINYYELNYNPVYWAKNYNGDPQEVFDEFSRRISLASAEVKQTVPYRSDIRYGPGERQLIDIFGEETLPSDAEIFVFLHGGYWILSNKNESAYPVKPLYDSGIKVIIGGYDVAPNVNLTTIVEEAKELCDFVLNMAEKSNSRGVWFGGHSAGAHMSANLMLDNYLNGISEKKKKLLKGFVLIVGRYDISAVQHMFINQELNLTNDEIEQLSPLRQKDQINIASDMGLKTIISIAELDCPGCKKLATEFSQVLRSRSVENKFIHIQNEDHFTVAGRLEESDYLLSQEIVKLIKTGSFAD